MKHGTAKKMKNKKGVEPGMDAIMRFSKMEEKSYIWSIQSRKISHEATSEYGPPKEHGTLIKAVKIRRETPLTNLLRH